MGCMQRDASWQQGALQCNTAGIGFPGYTLLAERSPPPLRFNEMPER